MSKKLMESGLTPKQELFRLEYIKDQNATRSAIAVGFSEKTAKEQGARLLTNVNVASCIRACTRKMRHKRKQKETYVIP